MTHAPRYLPKLALSLAVLSLLVAVSRTSLAFYTRGYFDNSASVGGAGKLYYTGSVRERRWTCSGCHVDAPRLIQARFASEPPELADSASYVPGAQYEVTASLIGETRGFDAQFNSNGLLVEFSRGLEPAGRLSDGPKTELIGNGRIIISQNDTSGLASWVFRWTAPEPGFGSVVINLGAVDGDGASDRSQSRQDHLNDDVFMGTLVLRESSPQSSAANGATTLRSLEGVLPAHATDSPDLVVRQPDTPAIGCSTTSGNPRSFVPWWLLLGACTLCARRTVALRAKSPRFSRAGCRSRSRSPSVGSDRPIAVVRARASGIIFEPVSRMPRHIDAAALPEDIARMAEAQVAALASATQGDRMVQQWDVVKP